MHQGINYKLRDVDVARARTKRRRQVTKRKAAPAHHIPGEGQPEVFRTGKKGGRPQERIDARLANIMTRAATATSFPCRCRVETDRTGFPVVVNADCKAHRWIRAR